MTQNEKSKIRAKVIKWVTRLFLILVAIIMLYPLAWNVVSSFKTSTEFLTDPFAWPQGLAWDNYVRAYEKSNLAANIGNSIYVVLETLVIIVVCVVPCSYCLVRYKFPGAKLILNIYMAAIFIQATYIMIPLFLQMNKLNLLNAFFKEIRIVGGVFQSPFALPRSIALVNTLDLDPILEMDCVFTPEAFEDAFEAQMNGRTIKSLVQFTPDVE